MFEDVEAPQAMKAVFAILFAVSGAGPDGASVHDISIRTTVHPRAVYRHLNTLQALGLVEPSERSGRFRAGLATQALAKGAGDQRAFLGHAQAAVDALTVRVREPVHLTVYDHGTSVTVVAASQDVVRTQDVVQIVVGSRRPAHASASGKLFLAHSRNAREAYVLRPLTAFTQRTIVSPEALGAECRRIREQGYSLEIHENRPGVSCIAVPVHGAPGRVTAALVASTQRDDLSDAALLRLAGPMRRAASALSKNIGGKL